MENDEDLILRIQQECLAFSQGESGLYRLMRHPVRKLIDYSGAAVHLQVHRTSGRIIGFDIAPRLIRALRLAACAIDGGVLLSKVHAEGPVVIDADRLRTFPLGPHLRPLASGHLVLHVHADLIQASRCVFVFTGVRGTSPERLRRALKAITPSLHRVVLQVHRAPNPLVPPLTRAEREICRLLLQGTSNKEIASVLDKSEATVRNQLHVIFVKLHVSTRTAAAVKLRELWSGTLETQREQKSPFIEHLYY